MRSSIVPLARVEARRLLRNPLLWLSFVPLATWLRRAWRTDNAEDAYNLLVGYGIELPGTVAVALVVVASLRARRCGTGELLATTPVEADRSTAAHALSLLPIAGLAVVWLVVELVVLRPSASLGRTRDTIPPFVEIPRPTAAQMAQGPLAVVAVGCFALAVARWIPTWLTVPALAVGALVQLTALGLWSSSPVGIGAWLSPLSRGWVNGTWLGCANGDAVCHLRLAGFDRTTPWWHAGYLFALACLCTLVAVARHRRDRVVVAGLGVAAVGVAALAVAQAVVLERYPALDALG